MEWCANREAGPEGRSLASIHPEPWRDAVREVLDPSMARMEGLPEPLRSRSHTYVTMHLEGTAGRPWSLADRPRTFGTTMSGPNVERVYVALHDTGEGPSGHTTRTLLRLMLGSGADD